MTDPIDLPAGLLEELRAAYAEPPRVYHSWAHVERVLDHVREIAWSQPAEVWLAALFHDAIYVAGAPDNEAKSAALARDAIARWLPDVKVDADRVAALIELTARHGRLVAADVDPEAALFLDCDAAVLAAPDEEFARYDAGIAAEWASVVTPEQYRAGRKAFLQRLLDAPRIFLSDDFHERLDAAARVNLRFALKRLG
jgi:predicted metal-dependent HD superfamily phosphohydrolase